MQCDETVCLDKKENTKVAFGSKVMTLDDFEEFANRDERIKNKMKQIDEELKSY